MVKDGIRTCRPLIVEEAPGLPAVPIFFVNYRRLRSGKRKSKLDLSNCSQTVSFIVPLLTISVLFLSLKTFFRSFFLLRTKEIWSFRHFRARNDNTSTGTRTTFTERTRSGRTRISSRTQSTHSRKSNGFGTSSCIISSSS